MGNNFSILLSYITTLKNTLEHKHEIIQDHYNHLKSINPCFEIVDHYTRTGQPHYIEIQVSQLLTIQTELLTKLTIYIHTLADINNKPSINTVINIIKEVEAIEQYIVVYTNVALKKRIINHLQSNSNN